MKVLENRHTRGKKHLVSHEERNTHSLRVVYKGVCLIVAKPNIDQILHSILPLLLPHVPLKRFIYKQNTTVFFSVILT